MLKNKIISSDKDLIGIVFFGTVSILSNIQSINKSQTVLKSSKKKNHQKWVIHFLWLIWLISRIKARIQAISSKFIYIRYFIWTLSALWVAINLHMQLSHNGSCQSISKMRCNTTQRKLCDKTMVVKRAFPLPGKLSPAAWKSLSLHPPPPPPQSSLTFSVWPRSSVGRLTVDLIRRSWVWFPPRSKEFFLFLVWFPGSLY